MFGSIRTEIDQSVYRLGYGLDDRVFESWHVLGIFLFQLWDPPNPPIQ
jgi:hypothetical protein